MQSLVSIVIPIYNGANYMREAIDSALTQNYPNIEVIVVNDGSTDDTEKIALSYGERIRYFEKENGGVSTALNVAIRHMRGEYFSWLSHDDVYYPSKVQDEMDALIASNTMQRVVYSDGDILRMPLKKIERAPSARFMQSYGKEIVETGALAPALGLISGCSLLIPKVYFDRYGLFDESLRAVQDYKKWFEMFRKHRMIYVPHSLIQSRVHSDQVTYTYNKMNDEEDWLYSWIVESMSSDDLAGSGVDLYHFYGYKILQLRKGKFQLENKIAMDKLLSLDEPADADIQRKRFFDFLNIGKRSQLYLYCAGRRSRRLIRELNLRDVHIAGISDSDARVGRQGVLGIPRISLNDVPKESTVIVTKAKPEDVEEMLKLQGYQHVISYDDLVGWLLRTPVKKSLVRKMCEDGTWESLQEKF